MSKKMERRNFLKLSALTAVSATLAACGPTPTATPVPPTATKPPAPTAVPPTATTAPAPAAPTATKPPAAPAPTNTPVPPAPTAKYQEAPMLADLVKAGKLPPVAQRLPANPRVIKPVEKIGKYGGTWRRAYKGLSDRWGPTKLMEEHIVQWDWTDQGIKVVANVCEKWEQSADASEFTFYLRKGLRWSDGEEVNTDDVKFWYEDVYLNKDLVPSHSGNTDNVDKTTTVVTVVDKYTWKIKFNTPRPLSPIQWAKSGTSNAMQCQGFMAMPEHYLKKFLPKNTPVEELNKMAQAQKLQTWDQLWSSSKGDFQGQMAFWFLNPDLPVISAWKIKVTAQQNQTQMVMERNPYFWKVDPEGNQLPYIDQITHDFFDNQEVFNLWLVSGKIDMQNRHVSSSDYTLLKENEKKGDYRVIRWRAASVSAVHPNINCPDPVLAKLNDTPKFRQALSIAINRKELNDLLFNGLYKPMQACPVAGSPNYDPEFEKKWAEYDPATANKLLDELGLTKNPDGTRKRPDGKTLELVLTTSDTTGSVGLDECQQIAKAWTAIGVKTSVKAVERSLYEQLYRDGNLEVGRWGADRQSIVMADPGRYIGYTADGPWSPCYANWYTKSPYKQIEPPPDHPVRKIYDAWDKCQVEPDETKRNALFKIIIDTHKEHPWMIGTCGEAPTFWVTKNNFRNVPENRINDDTLRDYGLAMPCQFYFEK